MFWREIRRKIIRKVCLLLYYNLFTHFPASATIWGKRLKSKRLRYIVCKHIFKKIGKNVNIEKGACFGDGMELEIGDNSGLGINCFVPSNIIIGSNVMMGPNVYILSQNHAFSRIDIPMIEQGYVDGKRTVIEDDVWIGRDVTFTMGRHVSQGSVIGACTLLCKDFPAYSVIGGNPSVLIKSRL